MSDAFPNRPEFYSRKVAEGALAIACPTCRAAQGRWCQPVYPHPDYLCAARVRTFLRMTISLPLRNAERARDVI